MTIKSIALAKCDEICKEMKEAQGYNMILTAHSIDTEAAKKMKSHSEFLAEKYRFLTALSKTDAGPDPYIEVLEQLTVPQSWYETNSPGIKRLCNSAKRNLADQGGAATKRGKKDRMKQFRVF